MSLGPSAGALLAFLEARALCLLGSALLVATTLHALQWRRDKRRLRQLARQQKEVYPVTRTPLVSILLPAWNEAANVEPCIESIVKLRYPNKQLIVCAGGSDRTLEMARRHERPAVIVLEQRSGDGKQGALRRSLQRATGEVIYLTDADCRVDDSSFEGTLAPILVGKEDVVTGAWRPLDGQLQHPLVQYQWAHHLYRELWLPDYTPTLDGRNAAVRRAALEKVGAFEIEAPIGTDYVLSKQLAMAGYRIRFVRDSHVRTEYPETVRAYWKQLSRWFRNPLVLGTQWGDWRLVAMHLWAGLTSVLLLSVPMLGALGSRLLCCCWLVGASHLLFSHLRRMETARAYGNLRLPSRWWHLRLAPFVVVGWIGTARGLAETLWPKRRLSW